MKLEDKLGTFAKLAPKFSITDQVGNPLKAVQVGVSVVRGPFRLMVKSQVARITGVVTESMLNSVNEKGERVYELQGNGWRPQARIGDLLMQDVEVLTDRWACGFELFGGTGWTETVHEDLSVTYAKFGKPTLALELPKGTVVNSREGARLVPLGSILVMSDANKGDFYIWTPDVVEKYVREYVE
jgi:hypothetical protein